MNILTLGTVIEYFDFISYALVCKYIPFFGHTSSTFLQFTLGYGSRLFGSLGMSVLSRRYGEQNMLIVSIFMITLSTICIGLLPNSAYSLSLMIAFRIIQGCAFAFELPAGVSIASQSNKVHTVINGATKGYIIATIVFGVMFNLLDKKYITMFGWRIPFFIGGTAGIYLLWNRIYFMEQKESTKIKDLMAETGFVVITLLFAFYTFKAADNTNIASEMIGRDLIVKLVKSGILLFLLLSLPFFWISNTFGYLAFGICLLVIAFFQSMKQMSLISSLPHLAYLNILSFLFSCVVATFAKRIEYVTVSIVLAIVYILLQGNMPIGTKLFTMFMLNQMFVTSCMITGLLLVRKNLQDYHFIFPVLYNIAPFIASFLV